MQIRVQAPAAARLRRGGPCPLTSHPPASSISAFLPEIILIVAGTLLMVLDVILRKQSRGDLSGTSRFWLCWPPWRRRCSPTASPGPAFSGMLMVDGFATFFRVLVIGVGILTVLSLTASWSAKARRPANITRCCCFRSPASAVMVSANELIMIFIGLEISSIASYVLAGYLRDDKRANEAALKYFLLGSFATAFFLYGVAVIYGMTGSTNLNAIRMALVGGPTAPAPVFIGRRGGADVRGPGLQGFRRALPGLGAGRLPGRSHARLRVPDDGPESGGLRHISAHLHDRFRADRARLGAAGLGIGAALDDHRQFRRAHADRTSSACWPTARSRTPATCWWRWPPAPTIGTAAAMFYLAAYALMNIGAFAVVIAPFAARARRFVSVDDFAGLAANAARTAAMLTIFLLSLIGVPLTGGFFGKFYIFKAALSAHLVWLTVLGLLNSAVAAYYYLRILVAMYMREPSEATAELEPLSLGLRAALVIPALGTLFLGIFPTWVLDFAGKSSALVK